MMLTRRASLLGLASAWSLGASSLALGAASSPGQDRRLVVVILRGAMDGLSVVTPYGDGAIRSLRAPLVLPEPGREGGLLDLGGFFGLHPALGGLHTLFGAGELLPVHAVAGEWRSRSHFEAQDFLESGAERRLNSGWLNRVVSALPHDPRAPDGEGLSVGVSVPLLLRGPAPVGSFAPDGGGRPSPDLYARIAALNAPDHRTGPAIAAGLAARGFSADTLGGASPDGKGGFPALARAAGQLLAAPEGPRVAALEVGGWDTHADQNRRLPGPLRQLDAGLMALRDGLGPAWNRTAVLVTTEFGRTARSNGTTGTDHGTATVALLLGGAIRGGRIGGTWPGLRDTQLFENRDLAPTTDLLALAKGLLSDHLGLKPGQIATIFPGDPADAVSGLIRS
ncbi:DUF1501 domain-containing protein [Rhizosaccharibacter radicis]|uniref:DUF1501 domain-containing protein n=1 Tax=Rhizosaccharibacter radicis TaxID=2782605 RepID=A0ABT1VX50_9PROT|nr:DUF1501 domain-containing protein [Acetobacteraceae bacterium KSS12]